MKKETYNVIIREVKTALQFTHKEYTDNQVAIIIDCVASQVSEEEMQDYNKLAFAVACIMSEQGWL